MSKQNLHPNTPFGKFFYKHGIWKPTFEKGIEDAYNSLADAEKDAIADASGFIAVVNKTIGEAPVFVWNTLAKAFPKVTKEAATEFLANLNSKLLLVADNTPQTFDEAVAVLQKWLGQFTGEVWVAITKAAVYAGATILKSGISIPVIAQVLEYVYLELVKPKIATV